MRLHFVWIGKTRDRHCAALIRDYLDRLGRFAPVELSEIRESARTTDEKRVPALEEKKLLSKIGPEDYLVLLDEKGREMTSLELAQFIDRQRQSGLKRMTFVVGGFAGVTEAVRERAQMRLSLSPMTFTHEMVRVILTEQAYRAMTLLAGLPYHKF